MIGRFVDVVTAASFVDAFTFIIGGLAKGTRYLFLDLVYAS